MKTQKEVILEMIQLVRKAAAGDADAFLELMENN